MSASTRQIICSETAIGRPASTTRSIRHRASSRFFCSRSIPSGIQPILYLSDFSAHFLAHRIQLRVKRSAESNPILAADVLERQIDAQFGHLPLELIDAARVALMLFVAALEQPLNRAGVDRQERDESGGPSCCVAPIHFFSIQRAPLSRSSLSLLSGTFLTLGT